MAALLTSLGEVATKVLTSVASVCSTITSEPLLLWCDRHFWAAALSRLGYDF